MELDFQQTLGRTCKTSFLYDVGFIFSLTLFGQRMMTLDSKVEENPRKERLR